MRFHRSRAAVLLLSAMAASAAAEDGFAPQVKPTLNIGRVAGRIDIDGSLEDAGWTGAARAGGFAEVEPNEKARPPVDTQVLLAYDDEKLYAAFLCEDDPASVRASLCERDKMWADDHVYLLLDTFGAQTWAYELSANPLGVQGDCLWSASGGEDYSFDVVFEAAGKMTDNGYQVEIAVPFASLRFPDRAQQTWRVNFWRVHPRAAKAEYAWAANSRDDPCWLCQWGTLTGLERVEPGRGLEILPALTAHQSGALGEGTGFQDNDVLGEPSLGIAFAPSSNFTAEGTYNPDFSQVESDAAQIDVNTTFALFYPEKRPFFQEGSDLFSTPFTAVYTRSINDPDFAAKLTGRPGGYAAALLSAEDENTPFTLPFEERSEFILAGRSYSNILRLQRSFGEESRLGLIGTDRRLEGGGAGTAAGVDCNLRLAQHWRFQSQALWTHTEEPDDPALTAGLEGLTFDEGRHTAVFDGESYSGHGLYGSVQRRARHWNLNLDWIERSPTFRADNGFEPQNDVREAWIVNGYNLYFDKGLVQRLAAHLYTWRTWNFAGQVKYDAWQADLAPQLRWAQLGGHVQYQRNDELFAGNQYRGVWYAHSCWNFAPSSAVSGSASLTHGHQVARNFTQLGKETRYSASLTVRPLGRLLFELSYNHAESRGLDTDATLFDGYITRGKLGVQLTRELSARLVAQYNDFYRMWEVDPLVTYRLSPFSIFYVGSTRDFTRRAANEDESADWQLAERTYFLKLQYLFRL